MLTVVMALLGFLAGIVINSLADHLPHRRAVQRPSCPHCGQIYAAAHSSALLRRLTGAKCAGCEREAGRRHWLVEAGTALLFATLPWLLPEPTTMAIYAFYLAVLILVIVIDLEHRLILHIVTFPVTAVALVASILLPNEIITIWSALVGAALGFLFFYAAYRLGQRLFGPGALGFGDVTLSMMMGAMLGFDRIIFALVIGILIGGVGSMGLVLARRRSLRSYVAYGPYLAVAGMAMLLWGRQVVDWYLA